MKVAPFENLIGKEMLATAIGPAFSRVGWQGQVNGDAKIEFVMRGANRAHFSAAFCRWRRFRCTEIRIAEFMSLVATMRARES